MSSETERKFLVDAGLWEKVPRGLFDLVRQGYLSCDENSTVRVRISNDKGYLTIKGKASGITRDEFEYIIPLHDAVFILNHLAGEQVEKVRYYIEYKGKTWEVDEFGGRNQGLILAEIELGSPDEAFELPPWAGAEVSLDPRYYNRNLALKPFRSW